jgi:hypothetical protein
MKILNKLKYNFNAFVAIFQHYLYHKGSRTKLIALGMIVFKVKIVQECKKPKIEMYKLIWGLVFKCNGSGRQFNSI